MLDLEKIAKQATDEWTAKQQQNTPPPPIDDLHDGGNLPQQEAPPTKSALDDLRDGGTLAQKLPGYQERIPQIEMAELVEQAIRTERQAIIEAATGTGKTMGYLIPVIRSGKKAIISTANKALQEQIYNKDVPFCQEHIQNFQAALLKGKTNYLCLERFSQEQNQGLQAHIQDPIFGNIEDAMSGDEFTGDFEKLEFLVPSEVKARINVHDDECARRKCPSFGSCYYYQAREKAKTAQVIVTNHDLLLLDAESHSKLLPKRDIVIIDEAHTLEGVATKQFTVEVKPNQINSLLALQRIKSYTEEKTRNQAHEQAEKLWLQLDGLLPNPGRIALTAPIQAGLALSKTIERLSNQLSRMRPHGQTAEEEELYKRVIKRTDTLAKNIQALFAMEDKGYVYFLDRVQNYVFASMTPLDVSSLLRDTLFTQNPTLVSTSATLSTPGFNGEPNFDYFQEQTGMDRPETIKRILPLVFDYQNQALLYLPATLPEPAYGKTAEAALYEQALADHMLRLVEASAGRAFLLFASKRMLNATADYIIPQLQADGYTALLQGDLPTNELIKQFRAGKKAVLFGLKTFWEGVDVSGEALSLVVIDKLPFSPMDDPIVAAKLKYVEAKGKNGFMSYSLPAITLALKQAVGRLIRSDTDTGVMVILDTRLQTKAYGRKVINCLPPATRTSAIKEVETFFSPLREEIQQFTVIKKILLKKGQEKHTYLKQMSNGEIIGKMEEIIGNKNRSNKEMEWLRKGFNLILSFQAKK